MRLIDALFQNALLKHVAKGALALVGVGVVMDVADAASDIFRWWSDEADERQRRREIEEIASASTDEYECAVDAVIDDVAAGESEDSRQQLRTYMKQVQATVRQSLRSPADPQGTTVARSRTFAGPDELLPLLPAKISGFKSGDRPLPNVDWELEELLGAGGFGEVWKARHPHFAGVEPVALKFCTDPEAARLLRHEAGVLDRVMREGKHPGIVQLKHTYLSADPPCLEYEYVEGSDMTGFIRECYQYGGGPTPDFAAEVIRQLAGIVAFAHELSPAIVHRDLKPANVLVREKEDGSHEFRITDFGIGGVATTEALKDASGGITTQGNILTKQIQGSYTPLYASPEQVRAETPDPRDDVYALGVIWYQLLTGRLTSGAPSGHRWRERLEDLGMTASQVDLLSSSMEPVAVDRPANARLLEQEIAARFNPPPPPIQERSREEMMIAFRSAAAKCGRTEKEVFLKQASIELDYKRLGSSIKEELRKAIYTARNRGILSTQGSDVWLTKDKIEDYDRDKLLDLLWRVMRRKGDEYEMDQVVQGMAAYLGFRRLPAESRADLTKLLHHAIRKNILGVRGTTVWRK